MRLPRLGHNLPVTIAVGILLAVVLALIFAVIAFALFHFIQQTARDLWG